MSDCFPDSANICCIGCLHYGVWPCYALLRALLPFQATRWPATAPPSGQAIFHPVFPFSAIGAYFLIATIVYVLGGFFVASGKLFKLANTGLIVLAALDNVLLIYTRTMPNIFLGRIIPWSTGWFPLGTVQVLLGQCLLIVLCAVLLKQSHK